MPGSLFSTVNRFSRSASFDLFQSSMPRLQRHLSNKGPGVLNDECITDSVWRKFRRNIVRVKRKITLTKTPLWL